jgi:hypothetical protein
MPLRDVRPSQRITITNEIELERARLQCLRLPDEPLTHGRRSSGLVAEMRARFARDDFVGALATAERLVATCDDDAEARACADG